MFFADERKPGEKHPFLFLAKAQNFLYGTDRNIIDFQYLVRPSGIFRIDRPVEVDGKEPLVDIVENIVHLLHLFIDDILQMLGVPFDGDTHAFEILRQIADLVVALRLDFNSIISLADHLGRFHQTSDRFGDVLRKPF